MAGPYKREAGSGVFEPARTSGAVPAVPSIVVLLAVGFALRLFTAYILFPGAGFPSDLSSFRYWGDYIGTHGPVGFYGLDFFHDYPPVYLYILGALGFVMKPFGSIGDAVKVVPMLCDVILAAVVWKMALELGASRSRALLAAFVVVVNPITWFDSAIWGQADSVGTIFLLLGLRELMKDRRETAAVLAVVAALTKPQLGILAILVAFVVLRRSLYPRDGGPARFRPIVTSALAGALTAAVICLPFVGFHLDSHLKGVEMLEAAGGVLAGLAVAYVVAGWRGPGRGSELYDLWHLGRSFRVAVGCVAGLVVAVLFAGIRFDVIIGQLVNTVGEYPYLTLNTYNPWALVVQHLPGGGDVSMATTLSWVRDAPFTDNGVAQPYFAFFGIPAAVVGEVALVIVLIAVSVWAARRDDRLSLTVALAVLALAFFTIPTRAHERYLFPFFGIAAVLFALSPRWRIAYVALSVANVLNLVAVLTQNPYNGVPEPKPGQAGNLPAAQFVNWLGDWVRSWHLSSSDTSLILPVAAIAAVTGLGLVWGLLQLRASAVARLETEAEEAEQELRWTFGAESAPKPLTAPASPTTSAGQVQMADSTTAPDRSFDDGAAGGEARNAAPVAALAAAGAVSAGGAAAAPLTTAAYPVADDEYDEYDLLDEEPEPEPELTPPWMQRAWRWLARPSNRPDRSAALAHEGWGRLDKLDLWIVVVLIVSVFSLRTYRLNEPQQFHFDEVYHARTAMEFLQDWRYGIPHDIYEWTHPHFAKYAIAGGIAAFADHKVTSTSNLGVPVKDAVVQPRQAPPAAAANVNDPRSDPNARLGDRLYVATGSEVRAYDLQTGDLVATYKVPGASALGLSAGADTLYVGTGAGDIYAISTNSLDDVRLKSAKEPSAAEPIASTGLDIQHLYAGANGLVLAADPNGQVASVDTGLKSIVGKAALPGAVAFASFGSGATTFDVTPSKVTNAASEAAAIASAVGGDATSLENQLKTSAAPGVQVPLKLPAASSSQLEALRNLITAGSVPGVSENTNSRVLVGTSDGLATVDARHLNVLAKLPVQGGVTSIALNSDLTAESYAASPSGMLLLTTALDASNGNNPQSVSIAKTLQMPGPVTRVYFDPANKIAEAIGKTPDGKSWTMYAIETAGESVFSDAKLPFEPAAWSADVTDQLPTTDRENMLVFAPDGSVATVDIGGFSFAWRIVGVAFGTAMAALLYLLARVLFRRRVIGVLIALFTLIDGMLFVQSRIAMNDVYVGTWLVAAYLLFALLWTGSWKGRWAFWVGMPLIGICLGLALASKWVALYAIASIGMLILVRSALGRLVTVLALAGGTGVLGYLTLSETPLLPQGSTYSAAVLVLFVLAVLLAIVGLSWAIRQRAVSDRVLVAGGTILGAFVLIVLAFTQTPSPDQNGGPNIGFFVLMVAITLIASAVYAYRPIAWSHDEYRFAVVVGEIAGFLAIVLALRTGNMPMLLAGAGLMVGPWLGFQVAGQWGFGPLAVPAARDEVEAGMAPAGDAVDGGIGVGDLALADPSLLTEPPAPAPSGPLSWLRLGSGRGLPAIWMGAALLVLPVVIYVVSYVPWAMPWQAETAQYKTLPVIYCATPDQNGYCPNGDGWPRGHTGKTFVQQQIDMYGYHNNLRSPHPASSPWWAWPMDLKPVWFESGNYAQDTGSMIYDGGNLPLWWLAIPSVAFLAWQAFKRRSLALALVGMAFFWQWLSWAWIDRATFQYHFYTALPFFLLALAYFLAELWHGPSRLTWLLARVSAMVALLAAPLLWVAKYPLCSLARVDTASNDYFRDIVCKGPTQGTLTIETRIFLIGVVLVAALVVLGVMLYRVERTQGGPEPEGFGWIAQLAAPVVVAGALLFWIGQHGPTGVIFSAPVASDQVALPVLLIALVLAPFVLWVQDPRRFVLVFLGIAVIFFVAFYPNVSALVMPKSIISIYNGLLPTWLYGFEFGVNQEPAVPVKLLSGQSIGLALAVVVLAAIVAYAAWVRRIVQGYEQRRRVSDGVAVPAGQDSGA